MHDLTPATEELSRVVGRVEDPDLDRPTPCAGWTVRDLLVHLVGLTGHFATVARHASPVDEEPTLDGDWRARLDALLTDLARAWQEPAAWTGEGVAGGVRMPNRQHGIVALEEVVLHGWDLARAVDAPFGVRDDDVVAVRGFVDGFAAASDDERAGLYGPVLDPGGGTAFDVVLTLAGRDPAWPAPARVGGRTAS